MADPKILDGDRPAFLEDISRFRETVVLVEILFDGKVDCRFPIDTFTVSRLNASHDPAKVNPPITGGMHHNEDHNS